MILTPRPFRYYDSQRGAPLAAAALAMAELWGPQLEEWPLDAERASLRRNLDRLHLLPVQTLLNDAGDSGVAEWYKDRG